MFSQIATHLMIRFISRWYSWLNHLQAIFFKNQFLFGWLVCIQLHICCCRSCYVYIRAITTWLLCCQVFPRIVNSMGNPLIEWHEYYPISLQTLYFDLFVPSDPLVQHDRTGSWLHQWNGSHAGTLIAGISTRWQF